MNLTLTGKVTSISYGECYTDGKPRVTLKLVEADGMFSSVSLPWDGELPALGAPFRVKIEPTETT
jgi:hypothetical protein